MVKYNCTKWSLEALAFPFVLSSSFAVLVLLLLNCMIVSPKLPWAYLLSGRIAGHTCLTANTQKHQGPLVLSTDDQNGFINLDLQQGVNESCWCCRSLLFLLRDEHPWPWRGLFHIWRSSLYCTMCCVGAFSTACQTSMQKRQWAQS